MGRSAQQLVSLTFAFAFSTCLAEVALRDELSPETTSFHHIATSAQELSHSSPHQSTIVHFNNTISLETTPMSFRTIVQTTEQQQVTAAPGQHTTAQAAANTTSTTLANNTSAAGQAITQTMHTVTPAVKNITIYSVSSATNTSQKYTSANTQVTAKTVKTVKPTTQSRNQTTVTGNPTATAMTNTTTTHPVTKTAITSTMTTVRPTPAPQPSPIPTGTYTVSNGNGTCIKAVMGLQLMAQNTQREQIEYVAVNPNATQTSGSCGMVQSELNLTFSGGFVNFTFVKQAPSYFVSKIESRMQLSSEGMFYYGAINEPLFTAKLGNSFKCASRQTFSLEKDFQILFVHMQLQAFDIVGNQFGKEEECFLDKTSKAAPIAVGLSILGLFLIVFVTFLISRKKSHKGYERI